MKYLVLKEMESDRKLNTNESAVRKNIAQTVTSQFFGGQAKKTRRFRSAFTTEQIQYLENEFKRFPYIGSGHRKEVSTILNIPERAIKIWFQNRRMKEKKEVINKETEEEQKKMNICQEQNIKTINHQSYTQPYTICQSKLKIYQDPTKTKASINFSRNNVSSNKFPKPIQDKITVKNFNSRNLNEINSRIIHPVGSRQLNNQFVPMKIQDKNMCITKVIQPVDHILVKVKQEHPEENNQEENPQDLTSETQSPHVVQPKYYQINQEQYMPLHVPTVHQPPFVPGNILWKPVNMMPVVPGIPPPHPQVHNNGFPLIHPNFRKECNCNCNNHNNQSVNQSPLMQINNHNNQSVNQSPLLQIDGRLHLPPQYVLAMPFNQQFN